MHGYTMKKIAQKKASNHAGWRAKMGQIRLEDPSSTNIAQPTACIDFFGDLGFRAGGYIVTCNKPSIWSCSGVGVLV